MVRNQQAREFLIEFAKLKEGRFTSGEVSRFDSPVSWIATLGYEIGEMLKEGVLVEVERTPVMALNYETYEAVYELKGSENEE